MNQDSNRPAASSLDSNSVPRLSLEEELRKLQDRYRNLFNSLAQGVIYHDSSSLATEANLAAQQILGMSLAEMKSAQSPLPTLICEDGSPFPVDQLPHTLALKEGREIRHVVLGVFNKFDNKLRWLLVNSVPIHRENETAPYQIITTFIDITRRKEAEQALRESQERFSLFMENAPVVVFIKDENSNTLFNNKFHREATGFDTTGISTMDIFPADIAAHLVDHDRKALKTGYWKGTELITNKAGIRHTYNTIKFTIPRQGQSPLLGGIAHDITEQLKTEASLRESEQRYRLLFQNMPTAVIYHQAIRNDDGEITDMLCLDVNEACERLIGIPRERIVNRSFGEVIPGYQDNMRYWLDMYEGIEKLPHTLHFENYINNLDLWLNISAYSLPDSCFVTMFQDITEMKKSVATTQQLNNELEQRVLERTAQLRAINKEIEAYSYSVSHDLRAPLRAISEFTKILAEEYGPKLDDEGLRLLGIIKRNVNKMEQLIQDLLTFSLVMRSSGDKTSVDMNQLVEQVVGELLVSENGRRIEIQIENLPSVYGNPSMLKQVWCNLISNALKFTTHNPNASIQIGCNCRNEKETQYYVKDNGVGFDMTYVDRLFNVFKRLHRETEFPGSGVGLAIVKRIIDRHGGKIWVDSLPGEGTTFFFALPVN